MSLELAIETISSESARSFSDIKIPSEHTICGKRFPAEYSIYMTHPLRRQTIVMSILLSIHEDDKRNEHLQEAIDEWQKLYDTNDDKCNNKSRTLYSTNNDVGESDARKIVNGTKRELRDETPFGRGGWDPFHQSLEVSIRYELKQELQTCFLTLTQNVSTKM